jgi:Spy/CpxP family protein refolding chaperone
MFPSIATRAKQQQQYCRAPEASAVELRLVASVHLADVVALDVADGVDRNVARKRHREVVAQAQQLTTLQASHQFTPHYTTLQYNTPNYVTLHAQPGMETTVRS